MVFVAFELCETKVAMIASPMWGFALSNPLPNLVPLSFSEPITWFSWLPFAEYENNGGGTERDARGSTDSEQLIVSSNAASSPTLRAMMKRLDMMFPHSAERFLEEADVEWRSLCARYARRTDDERVPISKLIDAEIGECGDAVHRVDGLGP